MWKWRYMKLPPLLKCARSGNLVKLGLLLDDGEQDTLNLKGSSESLNFELVNEANKSMVVLDWKAHVMAWCLYVDALYNLCQSHRITFSDANVNRSACMKLIASLNTQPTSAACLAFAYILFLISNYEKARQFATDALAIDPTCSSSSHLLLMIEGKLKSANESPSLLCGSSCSSSSPIPACHHGSKETAQIYLRRLHKRNAEKENSKTINSRLKVNPAEFLSEETVLHIFSYLTVADLGKVSRVSSDWFRLAGDFSLWKAQYFSNIFEDYLVGDKDYKGLFKDIHTVKRHWRIGECVETPLTLHKSMVTCLQFDNNKLITGSTDKTVKVMDLKTHKSINTITFHESVWDLQFNQFYLACASTGSITVFDIDKLSTMKSIQTPHLNNWAISSISLKRNFLAAAVRDNIVLWNLDGVHGQGWMEDQNEITGQSGAIHCLQFNDMHTLLSAGEEGVIRVWDIHSNRVMNALMGHSHRDTIRAFYSDGQFVVSGSDDGFLRFMT